MEYFQNIIAFLIALIAVIWDIKKDKSIDNKIRFTCAGIILILLSTLSLFLTFSQIYADKEEKQLEKFRLKSLSEIEFELTAFYNAPFSDDSLYLNNSPPELTISSCSIANYFIDFEFIQIRDVEYPHVTRVLAPGKVKYISHNTRMNNQNQNFNSIYLWELNNQNIKFKLRFGKFRKFIAGKKWNFSSRVIINGRSFKGIIDEQGLVSFMIYDFSKEDIIKK